MDMGRGEESVRCVERVTWKFTLPYVKQTASGNFFVSEILWGNIMFQETQTGTCINLEGWDGEGDGREVQEGGDIGTPMADSC